MPMYLIPVALVVGAGVLVFVQAYYGYRRQAEAQKSVRSALERGVELTPELLRAMGVQAGASDLRRGILALCYAAGCVAFGVLDLIDDGADSSILTFLGVAAFPGLIGLTLIVFHFTDRDR